MSAAIHQAEHELKQFVEHAVTILEGFLKMGIGLAMILPEALMFTSDVFGLIWVVGICMIAFRELVIYAAPLVEAQVAILVVVLDIIITFAQIVYTIVDDIIEIIKILSGSTGHFGKPHFVEFDPGDAIDEIQHLHDTCAPYNNPFTMLEDVILYYSHKPTCYLARYLYPVDWVYNFANPVLSMFYKGSADPIVSENPNLDVNCRANNLYDTVPWDCMALGAGFFLIEILIPLLLFLIILFCIWGGLWDVIKGGVEAFFLAVYITLHAIEKYIIKRVL